MYAVISCANDRASAGIKINVGWTGEMQDYVSRVELRRSLTGSPEYKVLMSKPAASLEDLSWSYTDIDTIAGVSYHYEYCALAESGLWQDGAEEDLVCRFEGVLLADETGSWHSAFGTADTRFAVNAQKNRPVSYIVTLSGKYPHRVSNTRANYWTGSCSAIWLPWRQVVNDGGEVICEEPSFENADAYRLAFMEWLMTDTKKFMKTADGKAMLISVDGTPQESYNAIEGMTAVSFDWTQIGEVEMPARTVNMGKAWVSE